MKQMKCERCNKCQKSGNFCLDCGQPLKEVITSNVEFKPIKTKRTSQTLKTDIRRWLTRIGVQQPDIKINSEMDNTVHVEYVLSNQLYNFSSNLQKSITDNLAAVEQFLHYRVLGIERGIESTEQAFKGYEQLPDFTNGRIDPYETLGFDKFETKTLEIAEEKFRRIAKECHPDVSDSIEASRKFSEINEAIKQIRVENK